MSKSTSISKASVSANKAHRTHIPWKEMKVGGVYERKDGKFFIYAGRATVYDKTTGVSISDPLKYVYIYIDAPGFLCEDLKGGDLNIICSSAHVRTSEYRDIAKTFVGMIPNYVNQHTWHLADVEITVDTHGATIAHGSTKSILNYSSAEKAKLSKYLTAKTRTRKKSSTK